MWFIVTLLFLPLVYSVDRSNFKSCQQSSFCKRHRELKGGESPYSLLLNSVQVSDSRVYSEVINIHNNVMFTLEMIPMKDSIIRFKINEKNPIRTRYEDPYALLDNLEGEKFQVVDQSKDGFTIKTGTCKVVVISHPLRLDFYQGEDLVVSANARGLLKFEHYRQKPQEHEQNEDPQGEKPAGEHEEEEDQNGLWEETFKGHTDSKPNGPASVGMDFSFANSKHVYGIPEHADAFSLKETGSTDPYRLYNLDVFEYELDNPMALYGSIPVMVSHTAKHTAGIFWHNTAETWIDIKKSPDSNVVTSITGFFSGGEKEAPEVQTHWISESGVIDAFVMLGPHPMDVFRQYGSLTGNTNLPPMFALAYHQSRWNYNDEEDVRKVHENFDKYDIPMDVLWLDIEHTDGKRYFTWDKHKFPNPIEMTANLTARGRKLVTIVDPHIKRDTNYFFYKELRDKDLYVKTKEGNEYDGWCWPGSSSYPDWTNPEAIEHYINTYSLDRYEGSTLDTFTWNDMNEPSVFNGPEITMQKDLLHPWAGVEHREIHNIYGFLFHAATYEGQRRRSAGKLRPFLLTRAAYAGSQRTTAKWTGDNTAEWGHLRISVPMLLSHSVTGLTHIGADIGGFFGNPDVHLLTRWYQAGAFQPFMRAHAHQETKRREPWLYNESNLKIIRDAIRTRYRYLPLWYTLFYENEMTGAPPMRPIWANFVEDVESFGIDNEFMVGSALLVHPVVDHSVMTATVYFPPGVWYDVLDYTIYNGPASASVQAYMDKIPVYQRGGAIVPRKDRVRRSSVLMRDDPYTLIVALDMEDKAQGTLYIDDEHTFEYREGKFLYLSLTYEDRILQSRKIDPSGVYKTRSWLERVIIIGLKEKPNKILLNSSSMGTIELESSFILGKRNQANQLVIRKPGVNMQEEFTITLQ
ncbi:glucosidase 2 subunit alpha isoform X2 [Oratosquilla oratoria]|uniref:glucosidase 2 subunit alpha isoform X2 n=1 Tax=Oratosquilla oratoria TaxID=337810 RepID=UPI003F765F0D